MTLSGVADHAHCEICQTPVAVGARVCGDACQGKLDEATRMKKRSMYIFIALLIGVLLLSKFLQF